MKDKNAPSRYKSAYMLFCEANREEYKKNNPESKTTDIMRGLAKLWKEADESSKKSYKKKADKLKIKYDSAVEKYRLTDSYMEYQRKNQTNNLYIKYASKLGIKKKTFKSFPGDPNAPKRPLSNFMLFSRDQRAKITAENPGMNIGAVSKIIGANWKSATDEEKAILKKKADDLKEEHAEAIQKYLLTDNAKIYLTVRKEFEEARDKLRKKHRSTKKTPGKMTKKNMSKKSSKKNRKRVAMDTDEEDESEEEESEEESSAEEDESDVSEDEEEEESEEDEDDDDEEEGETESEDFETRKSKKRKKNNKKSKRNNKKKAKSKKVKNNKNKRKAKKRTVKK